MRLARQIAIAQDTLDLVSPVFIWAYLPLQMNESDIGYGETIGNES